MKYLMIAVLGLLGVFARYFLGYYISKNIGSEIPYGTLVINVLGSFLIGLVFVLGIEKAAISAELRIGLTVGFLGGFTTFSSYSLELFSLFESAQYVSAFLYFFLSTALGFMGVFAGVTLARIF